MKKKPIIRERLHRLPHACYTGEIFVAITATIHERKRAFVSTDLVNACVKHLQRAATTHHCAVPVYCFMPDHLHFILHGRDAHADAWKTVKAFKQLTGYWFRSVPLPFQWQKDFYDHILRSHEDWRKQVRYIADNPVRAGLVDTWDAYPFTGAIGYDLHAILDNTL
ncbi:REP-associated tyrosine transposase [Rhodocaloribacter sp.]